VSVRIAQIASGLALIVALDSYDFTEGHRNTAA